MTLKKWADDVAEESRGMQKELFDGVFGVSHRGGTGLISHRLHSLLRDIERFPGFVEEIERLRALVPEDQRLPPQTTEQR